MRSIVLPVEYNYNGYPDEFWFRSVYHRSVVINERIGCLYDTYFRAQNMQKFSSWIEN